MSIAGPSGCGKSTSSPSSDFWIRPREGTYILNDQTVANLAWPNGLESAIARSGFIFQSFNLIGDLTVYENVELPLTYRGMSAVERRERVSQALEKVGMAHRIKHYPSQLSGGQQQRVAVARALGGKPSILLADEPTGNLDSKNGEAVMHLLRRTSPGRSDDLHGYSRHAFARHAERTIHLFDGRVVEEEAIEAGYRQSRGTAFAKRRLRGGSRDRKQTLILNLHE